MPCLRLSGYRKYVFILSIVPDRWVELSEVADSCSLGRESIQKDESLVMEMWVYNSINKGVRRC